MLVDKYLNMYVKVEKPTTNILMYMQKEADFQSQPGRSFNNAGEDIDLETKTNFNDTHRCGHRHHYHYHHRHRHHKQQQIY